MKRSGEERETGVKRRKGGAGEGEKDVEIVKRIKRERRRGRGRKGWGREGYCRKGRRRMEED